MSTQIDIRENAILASLTISMWTARKYDRKVTAEINTKHGASDDAGRYNKHLLPGDAVSYQALVKHLTALRVKHYEQTLAWSDDGTRLLPIANHGKYRDMIDEAKIQTEALLDAFIADYPSLREAARVRLNGMYKEEDYPLIGQIRSKFQMVVDYSPVPTADFRCQLPAATLRKMEEDMNSRRDRAVQNAMGDAWNRLYTCVEHLHERLATPGAIFRDSLVVNVDECCDVLARLNVVNDPMLEQMRKTAKDKLAKYTPDSLRGDERLRERVAQSAGDLMSQIRGTRRIRVAEAA
jgi:hypothetical protein